MKSSGRQTSGLRLLLCPLFCTGCIDQLLESPLILATGLGHVNGLAPTPRETILAATDEGLIEISADGQVRQLTQKPAIDVSTLPNQIVLLTETGLSWGPYPSGNARFDLNGRARAPEAQHIQAWYENKLLLDTEEGIQQLELNRGHVTPFAASQTPIVDLSLIPQNRSAVLAVSEEKLWRIGHEQFELIPSPQPVFMAAHDNQERMWLVHGSTPQLSLQTRGQWTPVVENLGHPTAITLGAGGLTPQDALYIATTSGNLEFIRVP